MRSYSGLIAGVACALLGATTHCGQPSEAGCVPGQQIACVCADGSQGAQRCSGNRTFEPCTCHPPAEPAPTPAPAGGSPARIDAGLPDASIAVDSFLAAALPGPCFAFDSPRTCDEYCADRFSSCSTSCGAALVAYGSRADCDGRRAPLRQTASCSGSHAAGEWVRCCCGASDPAAAGMSPCAPTDDTWGNGDCDKVCTKMGRSCSTSGCDKAKVAFMSKADCDAGEPVAYAASFCEGKIGGLPFVRCCCK